MSEAAETAMQAGMEILQEGTPQTDLRFPVGFLVSGDAHAAISGRNLSKATLLEVPLVLGRTSEGKAFAMRDSCPHRGIPLSYGHFDGKNLQCSYHGWEFDACSGRCVCRFRR